MEGCAIPLVMPVCVCVCVLCIDSYLIGTHKGMAQLAIRYIAVSPFSGISIITVLCQGTVALLSCHYL